MKRRKILLSLLLIFVFMSSPGLAAKASSRMNVNMNGSNVSVRETPVLIDGQAMRMDTPSYINADGLTFVHVRFVENYGAKVGWDPKTKTAIISQNGKEIRMTIDSRNIYVNGQKKLIDQEFVPKLVVFPSKGKDARTMIPFRLVSETLGYEVGYDKAREIPYINTSKSEPELKPEPEPEPEEDLSHLNRVKDIQKEFVNGKEAIVVYNTENVSINTMKLSNPERVVIDIKDSLLEGRTEITYDYELGFIKRVRVAQFSPDNNYKPNDKIVRIVLDIKDGVNNPEVKIEKDRSRLIITPEANIWQILNYSTEGNSKIVSINANRDTDYDIDYNEYLKTMIINLPVENIDLIEGKVDINDGLIKDINVSQIRDRAYITISFIRDVEYNVLSRSIDDKISVSFKRDRSNEKPSDKLIVIDPGHGGSDPGACHNGVREKDVNIAISLKLNEALQDKGYNTVMTRYDDTSVGLYDRPEIANNVDADLFISIHANSYTPNPGVEGVEILYCPADECSLKSRDDYELAKILMEEITKVTGAKNKNITKRPKLVVLNRTKMSAILIETGFLTNPSEAKLLSTSEYQDLMVEGIINGIEKYFNTIY